MSAFPNPPPAEALAQAERWFARLGAPDCGASERMAFERWRQAAPEHAQAWREVERRLQLSRSLLDDPALAAARRQARMPGARRAPAALALAAMLAIAAGVLALALRPAPEPPQHYATAVGEQRELVLTDGSHVLLDTDSALVVRYDRRQRRVVLERGRAQFEVAHDRDKPFIVDAARGNVRALGTRFQVQLSGSAARVLLLEGSVAVTAPGPGGAERVETLAPGDELRFDPARSAWSRSRPDLAFAHGWVRGDLVFNERRLGELVEESNRYATTPLRLDEPALGEIRVSGVFRAGNQASLVRALEHGWRLRAVPQADGGILLRRE